MKWLWLPAIALGALVALYCLIIGLPTTPMTVRRADRLFSQGVQPGQSREHVQTWLASQGIPRGSPFSDRGISFDLLDRHLIELEFPDLVVPNKGFWMGGRGKQSMAECAGLDVDSVFSVIRVSYPDAARYPFDIVEITVYLFFDREGRLLKHYVDEFHIMP